MTTIREAYQQRDLFKRTVRRPPAPEFAMQCVVADALRRFAKPTWIWNHIPGGEERPAEYRNGKRVSFAGARLKRAGFQPGWPDFMLIAPGGKLHCLELKRKGNKPTADQAAFRLWCLLNGVPHGLAYSVKDAFTFLEQWGVFREGVHLQ